MTRVELIGTWPSDEDKRRVREMIEPWEFVLPSWCHRLIVAYLLDENDYVAFSSSDPRYRKARIEVTPRFFVQDEEYQRQTILHEMLHVPLAPLSELAKEIAGDEFIRERVREALEGAVTDLTEAIWAA